MHKTLGACRRLGAKGAADDIKVIALADRLLAGENLCRKNTCSELVVADVSYSKRETRCWLENSLCVSAKTWQATPLRRRTKLKFCIKRHSHNACACVCVLTEKNNHRFHDYGQFLNPDCPVSSRTLNCRIDVCVTTKSRHWQEL